MKDVFYLRSSASCTSVCGSRSRTGSRTPDAATRRRGAAAQPVADSPPCRRRAADSSSNTAWIQCVPGDVGQPKHNQHVGPYKSGDPEKPTTLEGNETDFNSALYNYCTVTENSTNPLTNENISLTLGLERMDLAQASGRPWWISIGVHRPHWPWRGGEKRAKCLSAHFFEENVVQDMLGTDTMKVSYKCLLH